jgi:hypothetical protein
VQPRSGAQPRSGNVPQVKDQPPRSGVHGKSAAPPKSGGKPKSGATPHTPKPGSDSDVKLVGAADPRREGDSDIRLRDQGGPKTPGSVSSVPKSGPRLSQTPTPVGKKPGSSSKLGGPRSPQPADSGVRLVPMDSDSDVRIVPGGDEVPLGQSPGGTQADSNVRLDKVNFPPAQQDDAGTMLTDEINLDEELQKEEQRQKEQPKPPAKVKPKPKSELKFPATSPFELSDSDLDAPAAPAPGLSDSSDIDMPAAKARAKGAGGAAGAAGAKGAGGAESAAASDSSNFDLQPSPSDSSNFDLQAAPGDSSSLEIAAMKDDSSGSFELTPGAGSSGDDFSLELDESALDGGSTDNLTEPKSGINLSKPVDKGISLERPRESDDSLEFDLSLEPEATPRPAQMKEVASEEGSSEFELSLELPDDSQSGVLPGAAAKPGKPGKAPDDSDSEFELTLDDSSTEMTSGAPQVKGEGEGQDIFESDFEIPSLKEEGGGEPATVDTELESSDFDLALDDSDLAADEESGSQVVALDEEEVEPVAEGEDEVEVEVDQEGEFGDLEGEEEISDAEMAGRPGRTVEVVKLIRPAPWGVLPAIVMIPCVVVMLLVGLVGFELVQSSVGHRPPGTMTRVLNDSVLNPMGVTSVKLAK